VIRGTILIQQNIEPGNVASDDKAVMGGGAGGAGLNRGLEMA